MKVKKQQLELDMEQQTDWFKIGKRVHQGCMFSPCFFNLHAEHIMWNAGLDEAQARIKTAKKNTNNLRYADDTTLIAESDKLKKESEKAGSKLNIQKTKIIASGLITSWQIDGEKVEPVTDFIFLGSKTTEDSDCSHEVQSCLFLRRKAMTNLEIILKSRNITCWQRPI